MKQFDTNDQVLDASDDFNNIISINNHEEEDEQDFDFDYDPNEMYYALLSE